jgi:thiol-disulfide isomerase/thioredoxin
MPRGASWSAERQFRFGPELDCWPILKNFVSPLSPFWLDFGARFQYLASIMKRFFPHKIWHALLFFGTAFAAGADDIKMDWQPSGVYDRLNYYYPVRLTLSPDKPDGIKTAPADLAAPLYGQLRLGPAEAPTTYYVIVDEPAGKPSRLFVDANANGDLTDDPPAEWTGRNVKGTDGLRLTNYGGGANLHLAYGAEKLSLHLKMYRFDIHDPSRSEYVNNLFYYRDYGRAGDVSLGGKIYKAMLVDEFATGDFRPAQGASQKKINLLLDLNRNGKFEAQGESFDAGGPFKIGDTVYEVTGLDASGGSFQLIKSSKTVPEETPRTPRPPRQNLAAGAKALPFEAKTMEGGTIHFPESYKGKLVMLDFWATWCGPCRAEIPSVSEAYGKFHAKGFEILGVSLDQANASEMLAKFTKDNNMPWAEVYDGQYWKAAVAQTYSINSIPHAFLVDGDTGKIVAEGGALRGPALETAIEKGLAKRNGEIVDMEAGAKARPFEAKTTRGDTIQFPQSYKGKVVLLDFWATWCPPCRAEIPHVASAYEKYHAKGFEVLGVSLDRADASETLAQFTKENHMPWPEVYDGQFWQAAVAKRYSINSIPHAFLVDGDTGKIVAEGDEIRGENLAPAIEKALSNHQ